MSSLDGPFVIASTRLQLLHLNSTVVLEISLPHTVQLNTMGTSSLAMMLTGAHQLKPLTIEVHPTTPSAQSVSMNLVIVGACNGRGAQETNAIPSGEEHAPPLE